MLTTDVSSRCLRETFWWVCQVRTQQVLVLGKRTPRESQAVPGGQRGSSGTGEPAGLASGRWKPDLRGPRHLAWRARGRETRCLCYGGLDGDFTEHGKEPWPPATGGLRLGRTMFSETPPSGRAESASTSSVKEADKAGWPRGGVGGVRGRSQVSAELLGSPGSLLQGHQPPSVARRVARAPVGPGSAGAPGGELPGPWHHLPAWGGGARAASQVSTPLGISHSRGLSRPPHTWPWPLHPPESLITTCAQQGRRLAEEVPAAGRAMAQMTHQLPSLPGGPTLGSLGLSFWDRVATSPGCPGPEPRP